MNLTPLAGNDPLKRQLEGEYARRGLSHAYIISGPAGSGKETLAGLLSAALVCSGQGEIPCGHCSGCKKAMAGIHPDISAIGTDGKDITVAQVRALRSDAYIRPNEAGRKVYVIHRAQSMNQSAQNAMLKLLEEGPPYAAFLLLAENAAALLPTVRSRCEVLTLTPPASGQETAGEDRREIRAAGELLEKLSAGNETALAEFCAGLERDKWDRDGLDQLLEELALLLRDALTASCGARLETDPRRRALAEHAASALRPRQLMSALELTRRLREALEFNLGAGHLAGWLAAGLAELK